jgi:hypothetical protein
MTPWLCHDSAMAMSNEHKAALAEGRRQSRAIKAYLGAIGTRRPGRPTTKESLTGRLDKVVAKIEASDDPLETVELIQSRLDIEEALSDFEAQHDLTVLEADFVENVAAYSERKGISYTAWREFGVPASVLRSAGIKETRRR